MCVCVFFLIPPDLDFHHQVCHSFYPSAQDKMVDFQEIQLNYPDRSFVRVNRGNSRRTTEELDAKINQQSGLSSTTLHIKFRCFYTFALAKSDISSIDLDQKCFFNTSYIIHRRAKQKKCYPSITTKRLIVKTVWN